MRKPAVLFLCLSVLLAASAFFCSISGVDSAVRDSPDSLDVDSAAFIARYEFLTDSDYISIADSLGIEVAVIKAVVLIEAGPGLKGFWKPGLPVVNFDLVMFRKSAARRKIDLSSYTRTHPVVFAPLDRRRFGSRQAAQHARLDSAMTIDSVAAIEGTFWGMFQIGGFNWRTCRCGSVDEFVMKMSRSERDQLDLFAAFITGRGLVRYLKNHDWDAFSLRYNGPSYKKRGYDSKLAKAYARFSREQKAVAP